jgi:hypothetical protein
MHYIGIEAQRARNAGGAPRLQSRCRGSVDRLLHVPARGIRASAAAHVRAGFQGAVGSLDLLASSPEPVRVRELPYSFRQRQHGESKLDTMIAWEFGMLLADKLIGHIVPVRFALFAMIGAFGLLVHLAMLWISLNLAGLGFAAAQSMATIIAMTSNFFLNNQFTYRDQRLSGLSLLRGLLIFYLICGVGAVANVGWRPTPSPRATPGGWPAWQEPSSAWSGTLQCLQSSPGIGDCRLRRLIPSRCRRQERHWHAPAGAGQA